MTVERGRCPVPRIDMGPRPSESLIHRLDVSQGGGAFIAKKEYSAAGRTRGAKMERRLAAILAADVVGYSRLMGADEVGTLARLKTCRREVGQAECFRRNDHLAIPMPQYWPMAASRLDDDYRQLRD